MLRSLLRPKSNNSNDPESPPDDRGPDGLRTSGWVKFADGGLMDQVYFSTIWPKLNFNL